MAPLSCSSRGIQAEDVSQSKVTPTVDVLVVNGRFVTRSRERIVGAFSSVSTVLTLDMCMFRGPVVLRKALDQFVFTEKSNELLKKDFLARLQRFFACPTNISRARTSLVEQRSRVMKDKAPKNTTWLVLDHHPLYRTGRVSRVIGRMFEYLSKHRLATLDVKQNPCDQNLESQSHSTRCDKVPEIHSCFVFCCDFDS